VSERGSKILLGLILTSNKDELEDGEDSVLEIRVGVADHPEAIGKSAINQSGLPPLKGYSRETVEKSRTDVEGDLVGHVLRISPQLD
jgi:hypothetical protein